jgi:cell wall-associated NlpC family hydrolase
VTDVELSSTAPSGGNVGSARKATVLAGVVVTVLSLVSVTSARPAGADSLSSARAQAGEINAQLQADAQKVDQLSQSYDAAQQKVEQLDASLARTRAAIGSDREKVGVDQKNLRHDALAAYMSDDEGGGLESMFSATGVKGVVTNEYRSVATGNISGAVDRLNQAESRLADEQSQLQATQGQAQAALTQVTTSRQAAEATVASQEATLAQVKGQIATLVAQQQAAEEAAQFAAFQRRLAAATPAPVQTGHDPGAVRTTVAPVAPAAPALPDLPSSGGAATAVAAAESQLGVPYRWGGESPGSGFDCSGLTQWAWGRAGVGIPRTAQEQYDAIEHVSLGALEPGDLLFWGAGRGGISHVGMYVGGGSVINAPDTGEDVRIQPIWNNGLVGAGRP